MKFGSSAQNSQGTCPMVRAASPEDGNSLPPSRGAVQVSNCAKSCPELPAIDNAPSWADQGWKDPCLNSSPEKLNPDQATQNSQGTFTMVGAASLEDGKLLPPSLEERSSTGVSKCAKSHQELPAEKWSLADLIETYRGPAQWWGQHPLKTAGPYLKSPWRSAGWSKCAKWHQEPLAEKWSLADLLETHRGPAP